MAQPGISVGLVGAEGGGGGGGVTPGGGSSGFTDPRVIVSQGGALNDGPTDLYEFAVDAGNDLTVRYAMELGGAGALVLHIPTTPATAGQRGWDFETVAGAGAAASAAVVGGAGADNYVIGGQGGAGSAARAAGAGGHAIVAAGAAGANGGGGGANGGNAYVDAADGTGAGVSGSVLIGTQTASTYGTRYVQVGPAGGTVPLLVDVAAPAGAELVNVAGNTDALTIFGRGFIGTPVAANEFVVGHYAARTSATQYTLRSSAPGATSAALLNTPASSANGTLYLQLGGSFGIGWTIGDNLGNFQLRPMTTGTADIGSSLLKVRDLHMSRDLFIGDDIFFDAGNVLHEVGVVTSAVNTAGGQLSMYAGVGGASSAGNGGAGGTLNITAGNGGAGGAGFPAGVGGAITIQAGNAGARVDTGNSDGGSIAILGGAGVGAGSFSGTVRLRAGDGVVGGDIVIDAGDGSTTNGVIQIGQSFAGQTIGIGSGGSISLGTGTTLISMYGAVPVAQAADTPAATDLASVITLANAIRTLLKNLGPMA